MSRLGAMIHGPADVIEIEKVPLTERIKATSTYEMLRDAARRSPDKPAVLFLRDGLPDETPLSWSYRALFGRITQLANALHRLGVGPRDVTSILLPNLPHYHIAMWGAEAAGIANPINPLLEPQHIIDILNATEAKALITIGPGIDAARGQQVRMLRHAVPTLKALIQIAAGDDLPEGVYDFDQLIAAEPADRLVSGRVFDLADTASYFHTGGTTGAPKLVPHTHRNETFIAWLVGEYGNYDETSIQLAALPLFHVAANGGESLAPLTSGATVIMASAMGWRGPNVIPNAWKLIEKFRVNRMAAVPTVYGALLNVPIDADIATLGYCGVGAAPLSTELAKAWRAKTGVPLIEGWGMTESTHLVAANPGDNYRVGSIGIRLPYMEMKAVLVDGDGNHVRDCADDEPGVVVIRGPNVFPGYKDAKNNKGVWLEGGWFNTGDLGRRDADGYFWLTGRAKDLIIRGGHNIDPSLIEETLHRHPAVALAAAIGKPDAHAGELPMAYVVMKPGARASEDELIAFARSEISERAAAPSEVRIIDTMPVTAVGKIFKPTLRQMAIEASLGAALTGAHLPARVEVVADPKRGLVARVRPAKDAPIDFPERARTILGAFTVPFELEN